jgi:hypothetical protein
MAEKVTFILGMRDTKKHSTKFSTINVESSSPKLENFSPTFYLPKPFGVGAEKIRVTLETIE